MECYSLSADLLALVVTVASADSRSLAAVGLWAAAATTEHPASFGLVSGAAPHLAAAFDHGAVLGQVFVDAKSNEIPAARTLLGRFDLDGAVVAMDAPLRTPRPAPPRSFNAAGGTMCSQPKNNMSTIHRDLKALLWPADHREHHGPQYADDCKHPHERDRQGPEGGAGMR